MLRVHPNPARDVIRVRVAGAGPVASLRLLDATGRVVRVLAPVPAAGPLTMEVAGLPAGYYALEAQTASGSVARGLIVR